MNYYSCYEAARRIGVTRPCISYRAKKGLIDGAFIDDKTGKYRIPSSYVKEIIEKEEHSDEKEYVSVQECASAIFLSVPGVYGRIRRGDIKGAKKTSYRWRIPVEYIEKVLER